MWQSTRRIAWALLTIYTAVLLILMFFERSLIFFPMKHPEGNWTNTASFIEDANFTAADGTQLHGWYASVDNPRAVVLISHGNAGNVTHRAHLLRGFSQELNCCVLVFDYRGYGQSTGKPSEAGILQDARAARAWLAKKAGVPESDIVLMGESLGTGVVVDLAAKDGARGLLLHSAFTSLPAVAAKFYPWLPVRWVMRTRLDSLSKIKDYDGPLLQFHGDADEIVPFEIGEELHAAAPNKHKVWHTLKGSMHNSETPSAFYEAISQWLDTLN